MGDREGDGEEGGRWTDIGRREGLEREELGKGVRGREMEGYREERRIGHCCLLLKKLT